MAKTLFTERRCLIGHPITQPGIENMKQQISLLITDLDNTLFDWFEMWYQPFKAMLDDLAVTSGVPLDALERDFHKVHQRHGTSEYAFAIEELDCLRERHPGANLAELYARSIEAYRAARRQVMSLYPTVDKTLRWLKSRGVLLVAYTESMDFYTRYRVKHLGLDRVLDYLYSPPNHLLPEGLSADQIRFYSPDHYKLENTLQDYTPPGEIKPNPKILADIIRHVAGKRENTAYVGDSLMKDVAMAQDAGVADVWAKYGVAMHREAYELLRRVTHWTPDAVEREKVVTHNDVRPAFTLENEFAEIMDLFEWSPLDARVR
jgi:phosphoglycolate phosphatase-like HAD superfamily hydrolase